MKTVMVRLDDKTKSILLASKIEGNRLTLSGQLDRADYVKVAKAIEAAGGKWNKREGCHIFPGDVRETMDLNGDSVGIVNQQQTFQSFDTPQAVADKMAMLADLTAGDKVLEPSAGTGNLIRAAIACGVFKSDIKAVEIDPKKAGPLWAICKDFMACTVAELGKFDRILMNPPFSRGQDVAHIKHALKFLADGGRLVALCANGPKQREALEPLCDSWTDLEPGSFKESGTGVNVAMIVIEKARGK